jgi:hypothetical protein
MHSYMKYEFIERFAESLLLSLGSRKKKSSERFILKIIKFSNDGIIAKIFNETMMEAFLLKSLNISTSLNFKKVLLT